MWSPNELLKIEKQRDILSYITLQFFHFKKVPLEHCPFGQGNFVSMGFYVLRESALYSRTVCITSVSTGMRSMLEAP